MGYHNDLYWNINSQLKSKIIPIREYLNEFKVQFNEHDGITPENYNLYRSVLSFQNQFEKLVDVYESNMGPALQYYSFKRDGEKSFRKRLVYAKSTQQINSFINEFHDVLKDINKRQYKELFYPGEANTKKENQKKLNDIKRNIEKYSFKIIALAKHAQDDFKKITTKNPIAKEQFEKFERAKKYVDILEENNEILKNFIARLNNDQNSIYNLLADFRKAKQTNLIKDSQSYYINWFNTNNIKLNNAISIINNNQQLINSLRNNEDLSNDYYSYIDSIVNQNTLLPDEQFTQKREALYLQGYPEDRFEAGKKAHFTIDDENFPGHNAFLDNYIYEEGKKEKKGKSTSKDDNNKQASPTRKNKVLKKYLAKNQLNSLHNDLFKELATNNKWEEKLGETVIKNARRQFKANYDERAELKKYDIEQWLDNQKRDLILTGKTIEDKVTKDSVIYQELNMPEDVIKFQMANKTNIEAQKKYLDSTNDFQKSIKEDDRYYIDALEANNKKRDEYIEALNKEIGELRASIEMTNIYIKGENEIISELKQDILDRYKIKKTVRSKQKFNNSIIEQLRNENPLTDVQISHIYNVADDTMKLTNIINNINKQEGLISNINRKKITSFLKNPTYASGESFAARSICTSTPQENITQNNNEIIKGTHSHKQ